MTGDFLQKYVEFASEVTDAPVQYHNIIALAVLATALGNNVYLERGNKKIYPNMWVIILGPSSAFRKSTVLSIGKDLLRRVCENTLLPEEFSQEKLLALLQDQPQGIFIYYEFMALVGLLQRDYMAGAKALLTELFDCPTKYTRKTKGEVVEVVNPVLNLVAATTTEWFLEKAKEADMHGGFFPRFLYVPVDAKPTTVPFPEPADITKRNTLVGILGNIRKNVKGTMKLSPDAKAYYVKWFVSFEAKTAHSNSMIAFRTRLTTYCLKIACLIEISATGNLIVSQKSMEGACSTTTWLSNQLRRLEEELTFTRFSTHKKKVLKLIRGEPGITKSKLLQYSNLSARDLGSLISTLKVEERIVEKQEIKPGKKKKSICYYEITS